MSAMSANALWKTSSSTFALLMAQKVEQGLLETSETVCKSHTYDCLADSRKFACLSRHDIIRDFCRTQSSSNHRGAVGAHNGLGTTAVKPDDLAPGHDSKHVCPAKVL